MPQNLTNTRQYGKTLRVEFTLTKLQEDHSEQKLCHNPTKASKCPRPSKQLMTSRRNRNMIHALTTYPTHPKFGTAITNNLNQKTTPQVR